MWLFSFFFFVFRSAQTSVLMLMVYRNASLAINFSLTLLMFSTPLCFYYLTLHQSSFPSIVLTPFCLHFHFIPFTIPLSEFFSRFTLPHQTNKSPSPVDYRAIIPTDDMRDARPKNAYVTRHQTCNPFWHTRQGGFHITNVASAPILL